MPDLFACVIAICEGHDRESAAILHSLHHISKDLAAIKRELGILHTEQEHFMGTFEDKMAAINAALDTLSADDQRVLADLQALKDAQGTLTTDQEAQLDALLAKVQGEDAAVDAADPAPVVTPPADGGDTGEGDGTTTDGE
jgi:peptidoglycan hydrolase CwlO-like protein